MVAGLPASSGGGGTQTKLLYLRYPGSSANPGFERGLIESSAEEKVRMKKTATAIFLLCLMPTTIMAHKDNKAYILGGYLSCGQYVIAYEKDTYKDGELFTSDEL